MPACTARALTRRVCQDLTEAQHAALQQFMALKVLTNSTLMYGSCVGVLLKRDTDMPGRMVGSPRARDGKPGKLFRCVLGLLWLNVPDQLPLFTPPLFTLSGMGVQLAMCRCRRASKGWPGAGLGADSAATRLNSRSWYPCCLSPWLCSRTMPSGNNLQASHKAVSP